MATRQKLQLEIKDTEYSRFVKDQVLTEVQLNEIIDFFEDQHRLTRTTLLGTGIACGLKLQSDDQSVTLGPGVAVTTDGDLLNHETTVFTFFMPYSPPEECRYDPFYFDAGGEEKMIALYRLLTDKENEEITKKTSAKTFKIAELEGKLPDWTALLYLEYYRKKPVKCTPVSCDNLGSRQVAKPLVLVLSKADMEQVIERDPDELMGDSLYSKYSGALNGYLDLPEIRAKRIVLTPVMAKSAKTLGGVYISAMKEGSKPLCQAIMELYKTFRFVIDRKGEIAMNKLVDHLFEILTGPTNLLNVLYTWDFYKDIITGYNELRETLSCVTVECQPDLYAFPKHIMLGEPNAVCSPGHPAWRHKWYPSPVTTTHDEQLKKAISMLKRLVLMIENFRPDVANAVKVTPSHDYNALLEQRAIPAFYPFFGKMATEWNFGKQRKGKEQTIYSYHNTKNGDPLDFDIDPYSFFRVEGHIGMNIRNALSGLQAIRKDKGLPIELVAIRMGDPKLSDIDLDDYACRFEDLEVMLKAFQSEITCLIGEASGFFSGFTPLADLPHVGIIKDMTTAGESKWTLVSAIAEQPATPFSMVTMMKKTKEPGAIESLKYSDPSRLLSFCERVGEPYFVTDRIVKETLNITPESFGKYYKQALEGGSLKVDEFVEKARTLAAVDPDYQKLTADQKFVLFEYPTRIIGYLENIQRFIPGKILDINDKNIADYGKIIEEFCLKLKRMRARLEKYFRTATMLPGIEDTYLAMLEKMSRICCSKEKLEIISREITSRKKAILAQLTLANFCVRHPGLEHKAGVHRGGTLVLVYSSGTPKRPVVEGLGAGTAAGAFTAERSPGVPGGLVISEDTGRSTIGRAAPMEIISNLEGAVKEVSFEERDLLNMNAFATYMVEHEEEIDKEEALSKYLVANKISPTGTLAKNVVKELNSRIEELRKIICREIRTPEREVVIGDFCLPYLCASDCPPVAFIMEKEVPVEQPSITLPETKVCSNTQPLNFSGVPATGVVTTADTNLSNTVAKAADGSWQFSPAAVNWSDNQENVTVRFLLDGKESGCSILVVRHPEAIVSHKLLAADTSQLRNLPVEFTANAQHPDESYQYAWQFNDGQELTGKQVTATFDKEWFMERGFPRIEAKLKVINDICSEVSKSHAFAYVPVEAETPSCKNTVLDFIEEKSKFIASPGIVRRITASGSRELIEIAALMRELLKRAGEAVTSGDAAGRVSVMKGCIELLDTAYKAPFQASRSAIGQQMMAEMIRILHMLFLNMFRCDKKLTEEIIKLVGNNVTLFHKQLNTLKEKYSDLDQQDVLQNVVALFMKEFVSQDNKVKEQLNKFIELLKTFPA